MAKYKVLLRDDNGPVREVPAVIESDQTIAELSAHAHIHSVYGEVDENVKVDPIGYTVVTEDFPLKGEKKHDKVESEVVEDKVKKPK